MRIALVAPPWFAVPPHAYGGIERVVAYLADGLVDRGHDVTLFASGSSRTSARLVSHFQDPPSALLGDPLVEARHLIEAYRRWEEFDIIHDHTFLGLLAASGVRVPVVHTIHGAVTPGVYEYYRSAAAAGVHFVAISHRQRRDLPPEARADVIWNGLNLNEVPFGPGPGEHLLFVGRMSPDKGILDAIEIARRARRRLVICAKVNEQPEYEYFELAVKPALAAIEHELHCQPEKSRLMELYANAYATLFPIHWEEPFGLVMIESMAAGTPVIAFARGSVPEVVEDGRTGRVVHSVEEAVNAVPAIENLDRSTCRQRVRELFSAGAAVTRHEALYERLVAGGDHAGHGPNQVQDSLPT